MDSRAEEAEQLAPWLCQQGLHPAASTKGAAVVLRAGVPQFNPFQDTTSAPLMAKSPFCKDTQTLVFFQKIAPKVKPNIIKFIERKNISFCHTTVQHLPLLLHPLTTADLLGTASLSSCRPPGFCSVPGPAPACYRLPAASSWSSARHGALVAPHGPIWHLPVAARHCPRRWPAPACSWPRAGHCPHPSLPLRERAVPLGTQKEHLEAFPFLRVLSPGK